MNSRCQSATIRILIETIAGVDLCHDYPGVLFTIELRTPGVNDTASTSTHPVYQTWGPVVLPASG